MTDVLQRPAEVPLLAKPRFRGWLHLLCFEAALCLGTLLIVTVPPERRFAATVYAASVAALFGASALYHRGHWGPKVNGVLERLDHAMIFVLIFGSATPLYLECLPHRIGVPLLLVLGALTVAAMAAHVVWIDAPESLVTTVYIVLGLLAGGPVPFVWHHTGAAAAILIIVGGALYIVGAILFAAYRPHLLPEIFGYHEVWHCFVCAAAATHYVAIGVLIL